MPVGLLRQLRPEEITCPAGDLVGDACVHCRIEDSIIDGHLNPESIEVYCTGDQAVVPGYHGCPSWRADKHATWRGEKLDLEKPANLPRQELTQVPYTEGIQGIR